MTDVIRVDDCATKAELAEALSNLCQHAKRQPCVVETFAADPPTKWSRAHQRINAVLDDWQAAP